MTQVIVKMVDTNTNKECVRTIDISNVMISKDNGWVLPSKERQELELLNWIEERANEQHNSIMQLSSFEIV